MTNEQIVSAYTSAIMIGDISDGVECQVFANKFTRGNEAADGVMPLTAMLAECWPCDLHYTQYCVEDSPVRALKGYSANYDLSFTFAAFDIDFERHKAMPTPDDFANLCRVCQILDHQPNVIYATAKGARLIYLIVPVFDCAWFEDHFVALQTLLADAFTKVNIGYQMDTNVRDWARLYRAPRVIREGEEQYDLPIRLMHTAQLDLDGFKAKTKPARRIPNGNARYDGCDLKLLKYLRVEMCEGSRNATTFKAACHCYREYRKDDLGRALNAVRDSATIAGLSNREIETIIQSASKQGVPNEQ